EPVEAVLPIQREPAPAFVPQPGRDSSEFEVQVGQKWLLAIGILTMVFGIGYFLKYSFEQGWVGPAGRVAMAYIWGIVFLVAGDRFRTKIERFGLSLIGGGIAVLYFAAFAAFQIYHLFDQVPSFSIMIMITMLACALAVRYDTKWLAVLGLVGGFLTPVLLSTGQDNQIALMTYMTILNLGLLGIAFYKKWDILNIFGLVFTYLLYSGWYAQHYQESGFWPAIIFLNLFFLIYNFVTFIYQVRRGGRSGNRELVLIGINAFIAFAYNYIMIREMYGVAWVSIITVLYACIFLFMASYLYRHGQENLDVFPVMLSKALVFLIITVPVLFSNHWITVFWSAQGIALLWMAIKLEHRSFVIGGYALLIVSTFKFLLHDYNNVFQMHLAYGFRITGGYTYLVAERLLTSAVLLLLLAATGRLTRQVPKKMQWSTGGDGPLFITIFGIALFIILTAETSSFFHTYLLAARFAAISVLWTSFSVVLMLIGFRQNNSTLRKASFGFFLVVVLKVFLFDMSNFSTPYRIFSFIILGLVLVGTSYLYYRHKDRIITVLSDPDRKDNQQCDAGVAPAGKAEP
ncbi:MAG: hypothetical protein QG578_2054, partial [Thermodesulfobacteriota bacterium]|nr:hypothetical protein [Thermodesulfobacteriota bacterium]